jgi:hypothetical protein
MGNEINLVADHHGDQFVTLEAITLVASGRRDAAEQISRRPHARPGPKNSDFGWIKKIRRRVFWCGCLLGRAAGDAY